jgi:hypothetical protein
VSQVCIYADGKPFLPASSTLLLLSSGSLVDHLCSVPFSGTRPVSSEFSHEIWHGLIHPRTEVSDSDSMCSNIQVLHSHVKVTLETMKWQRRTLASVKEYDN